MGSREPARQTGPPVSAVDSQSSAQEPTPPGAAGTTAVSVLTVSPSKERRRRMCVLDTGAPGLALDITTSPSHSKHFL